METPLWRAIGAFRIASLGYAAVLTISNYATFTRPVLGFMIFGVMVTWTGVSVWGYSSPERRGWPLVAADLTVTSACLLASQLVIPAAALRSGASTLTMAWVAGPVLASAILGGRRWAVATALFLGALDLSVRGTVNQSVFNGTVLLLLAGFAVGYLTHVTAAAEARMQHAVELEAATRERERLARGIHDGVLQVLALVQRRGTELGGEAAELGRLAGEQEATLRALVGFGPVEAGAGAGLVDLRQLLRPMTTTDVEIATPATPVILGRATATELAAAVAGALDNVRAHAGPGAKAWVLVEEERGEVTVTVRDNGVGMAPERLAEAEAAGRLGVAQSIRGRIRELGGEVAITSAPGQGVEVEMRVRDFGMSRPGR
ncbi:signal transduction histidine kinase [Allocatelliglobosispora scoriae]|uniref:Signal transduction histidine kinase n=1 Tax=Allocatelliglobosispora scoriae TaxID=643052 RepID=A0A841C1X6_9ACTN|nr:DUF5931 domain-containing protein [Allocatelliglobosispora scoriae]MBB5873758.1 signal transduction histidine kinase [Allocatelliglobosispora scoriae]